MESDVISRMKIGRLHEMTIYINVKAENDPESEIAVSGMYNGTVWLSYGEQIELVSWFLHNRPVMVKMIQERRKKR
jgi:hypothetical protein